MNSQTQIDITPDELRQIMKDYEYDPDIFNNEDERSLAIKEALTKLSDADRIIWCLYMEVSSSRKLGKMLGNISHSTILKEISRIKAEIIANLETEMNPNLKCK